MKRLYIDLAVLIPFGILHVLIVLVTMIRPDATMVFLSCAYSLIAGKLLQLFWRKHVKA